MCNLDNLTTLVKDGNIMILQDGTYITLTPQQQIALKSLLEAHIDTLQFAWSKL